MVSIMDIDPKRQICDTRATLSQSAVSQKSIDLEIPVPLKSPTSTTSPASPPTSGAASGTLSPQTTSAVDTELAKRAMKLDLIESQGSSGTSAASGTSATSTATTTTHSSNTANSSGTTTTAIMMKHRKLKERTFSDELGSPKSPAAVIGRNGTTQLVVPRQTSLTSQPDVVDDRKALRDALYQGIFHRHRRTIFAVGSFLRMLKSRNSSYNTIRSSSEGEDDTR
ncbi:mucin-2 isoform X1 [Armigeres subalbatus]|uniref:mucin-2 isoform X1 n=1 Tax=Armigeres subalbatus TaxID=124917 RepID=UPI002ED6A9A5